MITKKKMVGVIVIDGGVLSAHVDGRTVWSRRASRRAALALGRWLGGHHLEVEWCYASSIDFPHENGGPRTNFRVAIAEGLGCACFDPINFGERP